MITAIVQFKLRQPLSRDKAQEIFSGTASRYKEVPGLVRKYYLISEDGETAGGIYLWQSREHAEQLYTDDWKKFIQDKYGSEPSIEFHASPVIVDNLTGEILQDD